MLESLQPEKSVLVKRNTTFTMFLYIFCLYAIIECVLFKRKRQSVNIQCILFYSIYLVSYCTYENKK